MTSDDVWPAPGFHIGQPQYLHALGVITSTYNLLEFTLMTFFLDYTGTPGDTVARIFAQLPNPKRFELTKIEVNAREKDTVVRDHVLHFLEGFRVLEETRNHLVHSHLIMNTSDQPHLTFGKGSHGNPVSWT